MTTNTNPINNPAAPRTAPAGTSSYPPGLAAPEVAAPDLPGNAKVDVAAARAALARVAGNEPKQAQPITAAEVKQAIVQYSGPALGAAAGMGFLLGVLLKKTLPAKAARCA